MQAAMQPAGLCHSRDAAVRPAGRSACMEACSFCRRREARIGMASS